MNQLIKSIELEPRNKKEGYIYFFDGSLKLDNIDFLKTFKNGTDNKILRFDRNFQIFRSFGNVIKRGVKFFSFSNTKKEVTELIISTTSSKITYKKKINIDESMKELIKYKILNYKKSKNETLNFMNVFRTENINENCNILDLMKVKSFSLKMIGIKDREVSDKNFLLLAEKIGNKNIIAKFLDSLIRFEFGVAEISLQEGNIDKFLNHCQFKQELESTEFFKDKKIQSNCNIDISSGILCIQTLGEKLKINIKPGKYKMYELFDDNFKNNKEKLFKSIKANEIIFSKNAKLLKKYPNIEIDDYELAMAYKEGYDQSFHPYNTKTPNNHFLLLSPK